jgi:hypothetical protein
MPKAGPIVIVDRLGDNNIHKNLFGLFKSDRALTNVNPVAF